MFRHRDRRRRALQSWGAWALSLAFAAGVHAAPLPLAEALQRVLVDSHQLAVYPFTLRAAEADTLQAGLRPNPVVALEIENVAGTGDMTGTREAEVTLALSQLVELGDKRERRRDVAQWEQRGKGVDYELARLEVLGETARRYVEAARAQLLVELARQQGAVARRALAAARERAAAGAAPAVEVKRLAIALSRAELAGRRAAAEAHNARVWLASLWGGRADFESVQADALTRFPALPPVSRLMALLESTPAHQRWLTIERLRDAQLRLAESRAVADVEVGIGLRHLREAGDNALVFSFSMPLQIFDRNQGGIAAAAAGREAASRQQQTARVELQTLVQTLYRQLTVYRATAEQLRGIALPAAREVLDELERGYRAGRYSALELMAAQDDCLTLEAEAIAAEATFHLQLIELERLTGQPLTPASAVAGVSTEDAP